VLLTALLKLFGGVPCGPSVLALRGTTPDDIDELENIEVGPSQAPLQAAAAPLAGLGENFSQLIVPLPTGLGGVTGVRQALP